VPTGKFEVIRCSPVFVEWVAAFYAKREEHCLRDDLTFNLFTSLQTAEHRRKHMLKGKVQTSILAACCLFVSVAATAQEVVHALTGTVTSIDTSAKTITVYTDNRSEGFFKDMTNSNTPIEFDKDIRANATAVDSFKMKNAYVIVFYFGGGDVRTAVALRSLGAGPFSKDTGTVVKIEGRNSISIADESGAIKSFKLTSNTVAETVYGAVIGSKYQPHKGDKVRVTAAVVNGSETALLVNTLIAN
jgi:hypothetical protein